MPEVYLSVIIPAYNEAGRIGLTLSKILRFLEGEPYVWEIILIDDGSTDQTSSIVRKRFSGYPSCEILKNARNRGKGYSVRLGMLAARGKYLLFTDADLSTPIEEVRGFLSRLENGKDVVIGSRALPDSRVEVHQNPLREKMGRIFNWIARRLAFQEIHDSQCGFKAFRREAARDLFRRQKLEGFSFDAEIIYLAQQLGYRLLEAPVTWRNSPRSHVNVLSDPVRMFLDLWLIRWLHRNEKKYKNPSHFLDC